MNKVAKIEVRRIPTIYPIDTYTERFYTDRRVVDSDYYEEIVLTDRKFKLIDDPFYDNQTIQTLLYNRYTVTIIVQENVNISLVKYAQIVTITLMDGTIHHAKILNLTSDKIGKTEIRKVVIEYADINPANYADNQQPVNNFLRSDILLDFYTSSQLVVLRLINTKNIGGLAPQTNRFYTKLMPHFRESDIEQQTADLQGVDVVSNSRSQSIISVRFYMNEEDKFFVQKYAKRCIDDAGSCRIRYTSRYGAIESVGLNVNENPVGIDCYQVDVDLKYDNIDFNVFN